MPTTRFGVPLKLPQSDSLDSVLIVEPTLGLDLQHASVNAPLGSTPYSENYIIRDGGLEPRAMLSTSAPYTSDFTNAQPLNTILGGAEIVDVTGVRYPFVTGSTRPAFFSNASWSRLSFVKLNNAAPFNSNVQPNAGVNSYWDVAQIYDATSNQNCAVFGNDSQQTLFCWKVNDTTAHSIAGDTGIGVFSTLSGAPMAKYVATFNDYILAANLAAGLVQRVQWNDRGSMSSWTGGLSGFVDLLDMRGQITRVIPQENRCLVFSDYEVWQLTPVAFPFIFNPEPVDRNVGCPYPWTVANTPQGVMFLSNDYNVYLLSKYGGPARAVGANVQRYLRNLIDKPGRAWASFDRTYNIYALHFPIKGGTGYPQQALYLNVGTAGAASQFYAAQMAQGAWMPQSFDKTNGKISVTRGFEAQLSSAATLWTGLTSAGVLWNDLAMTWNDLTGVSEARATWAGSSKGTIYYMNSAATSDDGNPVRSIWRSSALFGFQPNRQKTVGRIRVDYQADSRSTVSFELSRNQGASFDPAVALGMPANSVLSEAVSHVYAAARYPTFQVSSEAQRYRLYRFWLSVRAGGR